MSRKAITSGVERTMWDCCCCGGAGGDGGAGALGGKGGYVDEISQKAQVPLRACDESVARTVGGRRDIAVYYCG